MNSAALWPPPFSPFPPPPEQPWSAEQINYLFDLLQWRWQTALQRLGDISQQELRLLAAKLATPEGSRRFQRFCEYAKNRNKTVVTYLEWLDRVLEGYAAFREYIATVRETPEGARSQLQDILNDIAMRTYRKAIKTQPLREQVEDLASALYLSLQETYFFDAPLERWLQRTAKNIIYNQWRKKPSDIPIDIDDLDALPSPVSDPAVSWSDAHRAVQEAIRQIEHQPYRVLLLMLYVYENIDNAALAAFFAVPISRVNTWKSRAQAAGREAYWKSRSSVAEQEDKRDD